MAQQYKWRWSKLQLTFKNILFNSHMFVIFFCSTSLPLASTRWVCRTIKLGTVHSLSSALLINLSATSNWFLQENVLGNTENRTQGCWVRRTNATSVLYFHYSHPQHVCYLFCANGRYYTKKLCRRWDLNLRSLVLKATNQPTEPQPRTRWKSRMKDFM